MRLLQLTVGGVTIDPYKGSKVTQRIEMKNVIFQKNFQTKLLKIILKRLRWLIKVIFDKNAIHKHNSLGAMALQVQKCYNCPRSSLYCTHMWCANPWRYPLTHSCFRSFRAGVCRPCVETKLTATKKSATDGNWSVITLCRLRLAFHWRGFGPHGWVKEWCAETAHHSLTRPCGPKPRQWKASLKRAYDRIQL